MSLNLGNCNTFLSELEQLDAGLTARKSREVTLYRENEVILTVENGVTLGLLKFIYSSDSKFPGILQGVKTRCKNDPSRIPTIIVSDDRHLEESEYDLIIQDPPQSNSAATQQIPFSQARNLSNLLISPPSLANNDSQTNQKEELVCEFCHVPFVSKSKFERHKRLHTEDKPFLCVYCGESFSHHTELKRHRDEQHMSNKTFKCSSCPKTFSTRAELRGHLWRHTGEKNHKCHICGKLYSTKGNLKHHVDKHIGLHMRKCSFCPRKFTSHSALESHLTKHTGVKPYKCRFCPNAYSSGGQLTAHERIHTGERPFKCEICEKTFRLNSTRLNHERRHTDTKPFMCHVCGRSFVQAENLAQHLVTHQNKSERQVPCPFCKKKIFAGRNMRKHLVRHKDLKLTDSQAKAIAGSLKPDKDANELEENEESKKNTSRENDSLKPAKKMPLMCKDCNLVVRNFPALVEHLSTQHFKRPLTADEIRELRNTIRRLRKHKCKFCEREFRAHKALRKHIVAEHRFQAEEMGIVNEQYKLQDSKQDDFLAVTCESCGRNFLGKKALTSHKVRMHSFRKDVEAPNSECLKFKCWFCPCRFATPEEIVTHMTRDHDNLDRPDVVKTLQVDNSSGDMNEAKEDSTVSSTSDDDHRCGQCSKCFDSKDKLKDHMMVHQGLSAKKDPLRLSQILSEPENGFQSVAEPVKVNGTNLSLSNGASVGVPSSTGKSAISELSRICKSLVPDYLPLLPRPSPTNTGAISTVTTGDLRHQQQLQQQSLSVLLPRSEAFCQTQPSQTLTAPSVTYQIISNPSAGPSSTHPIQLIKDNVSSVTEEVTLGGSVPASSLKLTPVEPLVATTTVTASNISNPILSALHKLSDAVGKETVLTTKPLEKPQSWSANVLTHSLQGMPLTKKFEGRQLPSSSSFIQPKQTVQQATIQQLIAPAQTQSFQGPSGVRLAVADLGENVNTASLQVLPSKAPASIVRPPVVTKVGPSPVRVIQTSDPSSNNFIVPNLSSQHGVVQPTGYQNIAPAASLPIAPSASLPIAPSASFNTPIHNIQQFSSLQPAGAVVEGNSQSGFKMAYALAYVPVFIPQQQGGLQRMNANVEPQNLSWVKRKSKPRKVKTKTSKANLAKAVTEKQTDDSVRNKESKQEMINQGLSQSSDQINNSSKELERQDIINTALNEIHVGKNELGGLVQFVHEVTSRAMEMEGDVKKLSESIETPSQP